VWLFTTSDATRCVNTSCHSPEGVKTKFNTSEFSTCCSVRSPSVWTSLLPHQASASSEPLPAPDLSTGAAPPGKAESTVSPTEEAQTINSGVICVGPLGIECETQAHIGPTIMIDQRRWSWLVKMFKLPFCFSVRTRVGFYKHVICDFKVLSGPSISFHRKFY
jgi:hypothetical protein